MIYRSQLWTHTWLYYNHQSESERDTLCLRNYMYYKNRYQLQNGKADGHWGSYYADPYPSERETVSLNLNGYSCVQDNANIHSNSLVFEVPPHISERANNSQVINLNSNKTSYISISNNDPKVNITQADNINNKCYNNKRTFNLFK